MAGNEWKRLRPATAVVLVLALAGLVVALDSQLRDDGDPTATAEQGQLVHPRGNTSLTQARAFRSFPLYFVGEAAAGHDLEAVLRFDLTSPAPRTEFYFIYGACHSIRGQACRPPLEILLWPACYRYETRYSIPPRERIVLRGVPGRISREFVRLELYPAGTTLIINGDGLRGRAELLQVAHRLRGVNISLGSGARLPPRPPHAGQTIKCRSSS